MGVNELLEFLSSHDDLAPWLADWLGTAVVQRGKAVKKTNDFPDVHIPNSYGQGGETTYLLSILSQMGAKEEKRETAMEIGCRITEAVSQILSQVLGDERGAPQTGNVQLLDNLLFLIEGLPCSETTRQDLLSVTIKMYENKGYRGRRQENTDVYNGLILAMASLSDKNENLSEWEDRLARDLNVPDYTVAAFSVLLNINASEAIHRHLCNTIKILGSAEVSPANLMFGLAYRTKDEPKLRELILRMLGDGNHYDAIREFNRSVDALKT